MTDEHLINDMKAAFAVMLAEKNALIEALRRRNDELIAEASELRHALQLSETQKALLMPELDEEDYDPCRAVSRMSSGGTLFHTRRRFPV